MWASKQKEKKKRRRNKGKIKSIKREVTLLYVYVKGRDINYMKLIRVGQIKVPSNIILKGTKSIGMKMKWVQFYIISDRGKIMCD